MAENKTKPTENSVEDFIRSSDPKKIEDSFKLVEILSQLSGEPAVMWGSSIIGFGSFHYQYASGHNGEICRIGFSPRKSAFSLYALHSEAPELLQLVSQLGKIKMGKGCIYFKKLDDLDIEIFKKLIVQSLKETEKRFTS